VEAFLKEIQEEGLEYGNEGHINILSFRRAFAEFEFCTAEVRHTYGLQDDIGCPACGPEPRSIHLDGNHKLFTRNRNYEAWRPPYHRSAHLFRDDMAVVPSGSSRMRPLFHDDTSVLDFVELCDTARGVQTVEHSECGGKVWKAGSDKKKVHADKHYTGRMFGVCKHTCALSATNIIKTGERYGYAFYLLVQEFGPRNLKFSHIDVNCLHTPWREFTTNAFQTSTNPTVLNAPARAKVLQFKLANVTALVSEMHCKLHDPFCQALNSPASNPKTDRTTGEEVEQFNSCASTWTNTRNMGSAASIEEITSNTMYWNRIKHQGQAKSLRERHDRTSTRLKEDESKLEAVKEELSRRFPTVDISFETAYRDHRVVAEEQSQRLRRLKKDAPVVEYLKLQQRLEDAKKLSDFVASSSNPERLVFDDDGTRLSLLHENAKAIVDDISRMEARYVYCISMVSK